MNMFLTLDRGERFLRMGMWSAAIALAALFFFVRAPNANALVCTFSGGAGADFNAVTSWSNCGGGAPGVGDWAVVSSTASYTATTTALSGNITVGYLSVSGTGTVVSSTSWTLAVNNETYIEGMVTSTTGILNLTGNVSSTGELGTNSGDIMLGGTLTLSSGSVLEVGSGSSTVIGATVSTGTMNLRASGRLNLRSTLWNSGTLQIRGGTVTTTGNVTSTGTINGGTGNWEIMAGYATTDGATFTAGNTGKVKIKGTTNQFIQGSTWKNLIVDKVASTATIVGSDGSVTGWLNVSSTGALNVGSQNFSVTGQTMIGDSSAVTSTSGSLSFAGDVTSTGSIGTGSGSITFASTFENGGGSLNVGAGSSTVMTLFNNTGTVTLLTGGRFYLPGAFLNDGTLDIGGGTVTSVGNVTSSGSILGGSGMWEILKGYATTSAASFDTQSGTVKLTGSNSSFVTGSKWNNLIVDKTAATATMVASIGSVDMELITRNTGALDAGALSLDVAGTATLNDSSAVTSTSGTLLFEGDVTSTGSIGTDSGSITFASTYENGGGTLTIGAGSSTVMTLFNNTGTVTLASGGRFYLPRTFLNDGTLQIGLGTVTTVGNVTSTGAILGGPGIWDIMGTRFETSGAGTFTVGPGGSTVRIKGTTDQFIQGSTWGNLIVDKVATTATIINAATVITGWLNVSSTGAFNAADQDLRVDGISMVGNSSAVTSTSGTLTFLGDVTSTGAIGTDSGGIMFNSTLENNGQLMIGAGSSTMADNVQSTGTIVLLSGGRLNQNAASKYFYHSGTLTVGAGTVTTTGSVTSTGAITIGTGNWEIFGNYATDTGATFTAGTGSVKLKGSRGQEIQGSTWNNLVVDKSASTATLINAAGSITGWLNTSSTGALNTAALNLAITGLAMVGNSSAVTSTSGSITFAGVVTSTGSIGTGSGSITFASNFNNGGGSLNVGAGSSTVMTLFNNTGTVSLVTGGRFYLSLTFLNDGTLDIGDGTVTTTGNVTSTGTIVVGGGAAGIWDIMGTRYETSGAGIINANPFSTVRLKGTTNQFIQGSNFSNLIVDKAATTATFINADASTAGLDMYSTGALSAGSQVFTVNGNTTINDSSAVTSTSGSIIFTGVVTSTGSIGTDSGSITFASTFSNGGGTLNVGAGSSTVMTLFNNTGTVTLLTGGRFYLSGAFLNDGTLNIGGGTVTSVGNVTSTGSILGGSGMWEIMRGYATTSAATFDAEAGTVKLTGSNSAFVTGSRWNNLIVDKTAATATMVASMGSVDMALVTRNTGALDVGALSLTVAGSATLNNSSAVTSTSGTILFEGDVTSTGSIGTTNGSITFASTYENGGGTLNIGAGSSTVMTLFNNTGTVYLVTGGRFYLPRTFLNDGTLNIGGGTVTSVGNVTSTGTINGNTGNWEIMGTRFETSGAGLFDGGTGTVKIKGAANQFIQGSSSFNNLIVDKVATTATLINTSSVINGWLNVSSTGALNSVDYNIDVVGRTMIGGSSAVTSTSGTLTFYNDVTSTGSIGTDSGSILFQSTFENGGGSLMVGAGSSTVMTLFNNTGTVSLVTGGRFYIPLVFLNDGTLNIGGGTVTSVGNVTSTGTINGNTGVWEIAGSYATSATAVFTAGTGTVKLTGTNSAFITGSTFNNLRSNKVGGTATLVSNNSTVGGTLNASSTGIINAADTNLSVTGITIVADSAKVTSTSGSLTFADVVTSTGSIGTDSGSVTFASTFNNGGGTLNVGAGSSTVMTLFNNTGTVTLVTGGRFYLPAAFLNDGTLNIGGGTVTSVGNVTSTGTINGNTGNWEIMAGYVTSGSATFTAGTGTVKVKGTTNQFIQGSTFYNLVVDKAATTATLVNAAGSVTGWLNTSSTGALSAADQNLAVTGIAMVGNSSAVTSTTGVITFLGDVTSTGAIGTDSGGLMFNSTLENNGQIVIGAGSSTMADNVQSTGTIVLLTGGRLNQNAAAKYFYHSGTLSIGAGTVTTTGSVTSTGAITVGTGNWEIFGNYDVTDGATFTAGTGSVKLKGTRLQEIQGSTFYNLIVDKSASTATLTNAATAVGGWLNVSSTGALDADDQNLTVTGLTMVGNSSAVTSTTGVITFLGDVTSTGAIGTDSGGLMFNSTLENNGQIVIGAGSSTMADNVQSTGTIVLLTGGRLNQNAATKYLYHSGTLTIGPGTVTTTGSVTSTGAITLTTGNWEIFGNYATDTGATFTRGTTDTVKLKGSRAQEIQGSTWSNLVVDKAASTATLINAAGSVAGWLNTSSTGALNTAALNLAVTGIAMVGNSSAVTSTSGSLTFAGVVTSTGSIGSDSGSITFGSTFNNGGGSLNIGSGSSTVMTLFNNTGTVSLVTGGRFYIPLVFLNNGTLNIGGGTVTSVGNVTSTGAINGNTGNWEIASSYATSGSATFTAGTGTVKLTGTNSAFITGSTFNNLRSNKVGGTATLVSNNSTVGGTLNASSTGIINAAGTNLSVTGITIVADSAKVTSTSGTLTFTGAVSSTGSIGSSSGNSLFSSTFVNNGTFNVGAGTATTTGTLTNSGAGTITGNGGTMSVYAGWTNSGTFTYGSSTVRFSGAADQTIPAVNFYNLDIRTVGNASFSATTTAGGTTNIGSNSTLTTGNFTITLTGLITNNGTLTRSTRGKIVHTNESTQLTNSAGVPVASYSEGALVFVTLQDSNRNLSGTGVETMQATLTVSNAGGGDSEVITLTETGANTGIFRNSTGLPLMFRDVQANNGVIDARNNGTITVDYTDNQDDSDVSSTVRGFTMSSAAAYYSGGGSGGGGIPSGGGGSSSSPAPVVTAPVTTTPVTPPVSTVVYPPINTVVAPANTTTTPPITTTVKVAPSATDSTVKFTAKSSSVALGKKLTYSYVFTNKARKTVNTLLERELIGPDGKRISLAKGSATVKAGKTFNRSVTESVSKKAKLGVYRVIMRVKDAKTKALITSSELKYTVKKK